MSPIGKKNLMFRRTTNRYAKKGSISNNKGYLSIARDSPSGKFHHVLQQANQSLIGSQANEIRSRNRNRAW